MCRSRGATLSGAILVDATLVGVDLSDANLTDGLLAGADFTGADLANAFLTGANFFIGAALDGVHGFEFSEEQLRTMARRPDGTPGQR